MILTVYIVAIAAMLFGPNNNAKVVALALCVATSFVLWLQYKFPSCYDASLTAQEFIQLC